MIHKIVAILLFLLPLPAFATMDWDLSKIRAGFGYAPIFGQIANHFKPPIIYSLEVELLNAETQTSPLSIPIQFSSVKLYSDDVRTAYLLQGYSLSSGLAYRWRHSPWWMSRPSLGLSAFLWQLSARHFQAQSEATRSYTMGLYSEWSEELQWHPDFSSSLFLKISYPELGVANLLLELGLGIVYEL